MWFLGTVLKIHSKQAFFFFFNWIITHTTGFTNTTGSVLQVALFCLSGPHEAWWELPTKCTRMAFSFHREGGKHSGQTQQCLACPTSPCHWFWLWVFCRIWILCRLRYVWPSVDVLRNSTSELFSEVLLETSSFPDMDVLLQSARVSLSEEVQKCPWPLCGNSDWSSWTYSSERPTSHETSFTSGAIGWGRRSWGSNLTLFSVSSLLRSLLNQWRFFVQVFGVQPTSLHAPGANVVSPMAEFNNVMVKHFREAVVEMFEDISKRAVRHSFIMERWVYESTKQNCS